MNKTPLEAQAPCQLPTPAAIIFYLIAACDRDTVPRDMHWWQTTIRQLQDEMDFAALLDAFVFSAKVDIYPFSRKLSTCLTAGLFGFIATDTFDQRIYRINPQVRADILAKAPGRFGVLLPHYQAVSQAFAESCRIWDDARAERGCEVG
ncbi:hypothetical protein HY523_01440 [Candidatus Berkelbacteria bacterium]|nr:hypothetical protein [Candidatus Berkelbacteria bacterium]